MESKIRIAKVEDAESFVEIKNKLPLNIAEGSIAQGGFLLGTDIETYRYYIENGFCLVAEQGEKVVGFGIVLNDSMLKESPIWERRNLATWHINLEKFENRQLSFFEQLAFLEGNRRLALSLAFNLVKWVFDNGYNTMFTSSVKEPVYNGAALPFILMVEGINAGYISEEYPVYGKVVSDIYLVEKALFYASVASHPLYEFFDQNTILL